MKIINVCYKPSGYSPILARKTMKAADSVPELGRAHVVCRQL